LLGLLALSKFAGSPPEFFGDTWNWDGTDWHQAHPSRSPEPRAEPVMAYDPGSGRVLLFGGIGAHAFNDTWTWNGMDWAQEHPSVSPPTGDGFLHTFKAVSDEADQSVLLVTSGGDTWRWKKGDWVRVGSQPEIGFPLVIGFDRLSGQVIGRFGKSSSRTGTCNSETRIWTGSSFALASTETSLNPPACDAGFAFVDSQSGHMVVMSGFCCPHHIQTWSGLGWTDSGIVDSPKSSKPSVVDGTWSTTSAAVAALASPRQVIAFGVYSCQSRPSEAGPNSTADTLTWDAAGASAWTVASPAHHPSFRARTAMASDMPRRRVVLFGGTTSGCISFLPF
jgi:hypothetical protein